MHPLTSRRGLVRPIETLGVFHETRNSMSRSTNLVGSVFVDPTNEGTPPLWFDFNQYFNQLNMLPVSARRCLRPRSAR